MWIGFLAAAATAGTLTLKSVSPVSTRVDGEWIGRVTNEATAELPAGKHVIEVCDVLGNVVGTTEVRLEDDVPLVLVYADHKIDPEVVVPPTPEVAGPAPMADPSFKELERSLVGGSPKRRLERLGEGIAGQWFTMRQVGDLLLAFDVADDRVTAALLLAPRTIDPQNVGAIEGRFPSSAQKQQVRDAFAAPR